MGASHFDQIFANSFIGGVGGGNPFGSTFYVKASDQPGQRSDAFSGLSPLEPLANIQTAIANAAEFDTIILSPGLHTSLTETLGDISPKKGQVFRGPIPSFGGKPLATIHVESLSTSVQLVAINVSESQWHDLVFKARATTSQELSAEQIVLLGGTSSGNGTILRNCHFSLDSIDPAGTDFVGLNFNLGSAQVDVLNCSFFGALQSSDVPSYIKFGDSTSHRRSKIVGCVFEAEETTVLSINFSNPSVSLELFAVTVAGNFFIGTPVSASPQVTAINVTSGTNDTVIAMITNNRFVNITNPVSADKLGKSFVENFISDTQGGILVDPTPSP